MTKQEFLISLDRALEVPEGTLTGGEKLEDLENWNSMAVLEYISLADTVGAKELSPRQIRECQTVADLLKLAKIAA